MVSWREAARIAVCTDRTLPVGETTILRCAPSGAASSPIVRKARLSRTVAPDEVRRRESQRERESGDNAPRPRERDRCEVQQLLRADQRRLVRHSRDLYDRCVHVEIVAVVVFPFPEIDEPG